MNVLLISQCTKNALTETRRILDQFAERRGDRTWQTPITQQGLDTLHRLLRKTARKNTAVACHWIRGKDHSELLWVVGDLRRFNADGGTPTNTTERNILRGEDENDWHTGELICLLVDLAGLLHDLGKAIDAFQSRLEGRLVGRNRIRHEWVSVRLFEAFVGDDDDAAWLARLASPTEADNDRWLKQLRKDGLDGAFDSPFKTLSRAPIAQALAWLVVTHHRLPELPREAVFQMSSLPGLLTQLQPAWNERAFDTSDREALGAYWHFTNGLPVTTDAWRQRASRIARRLSPFAPSSSVGTASESVLDNPFVMHLARLSLMLADHHYSSLEGAHPERIKVTPGNPLLANTCRKDGSPNQSLDEHLLGVARHGSQIARFLPRFEQHLPRVGRHKRLKQRARDERFRWQDKSFDLAGGMRERSREHGAFIVNMASTGCGKTLGNARIMYALADPAQGMRCVFALGLRTLTLQTGKAFRDMLGLGDDDLAIRVGGSAQAVGQFVRRRHFCGIIRSLLIKAVIPARAHSKRDNARLCRARRHPAAGRVTIWLDAQLPPALATCLASKFETKCLAVRDLGLRDSDDQAIFQAARDQGGVVIMSKDSDFVELALRLGPPPRILWLTGGNVTNTHLRRILAEVLPAASPNG
ncbi:type I-F CRISPR-associated helicase Cas3f [Thiocapsa rosea]|uniref:CRISPR-associated helicase Cas3 subtype I-F n=1 Tax=Thiocapsa rosea TaxID=69360 RepID=A0A495V9I7_9GAMM|nr:type I-F CRISPR-associated helicase Cas3f [Thiocapsa rosea]RKT46062.1 CRISPR-associated helicase Cas3 subtype I-F [Thiocapsa rosea]